VTVQAILYVAAVGSVLALLTWAVTTIRTDPRGYTHVATCSADIEAERACRLLEKTGIRVIVDDHSYRSGWVWSRREGPVRFLVPDERVNEAAELLQAHVAAEQRFRYMRVSS
jgi:hypothetical protein